jgi:catalase (peroxidase I)
MNAQDKKAHDHLLGRGWDYKAGQYFEPGNSWPDGLNLQEAIGVQQAREDFKFSVGFGDVP